MVLKCLTSTRKNSTCLEKSCRISGLFKSGPTMGLHIHLFPLCFPSQVYQNKTSLLLCFQFSHVHLLINRFLVVDIGNRDLRAKYSLKKKGVRTKD